MRRSPRLPFTAAASFAAMAASASGQELLRAHDGFFNSDGSDARFAAALDFVGDVDGDGVGDYVVGAPRTTSGGEAYVYSGKSGAFLYPLVSDGAGFEFGSDLGPMGDLDGDGRADFFVLAPLAPQAQYLSSDGRIYLISGATGTVLRKIDGANRELLHRAVGIGDVDGDHVPDVAAVSLVFGDAHAYSGATGALLWSLEKSGLTTFLGALAALGDVDGDDVPDLAAAAFQFFGTPYVGVYSGADSTEIRRHPLAKAGALDLASVPDVDGDGVRELVAGSENEASNAGVVHVWSGANGNELYSLTGALPGDYFGDRVRDAGDVNGDGVHEIAAVSFPSGSRTNVLVQLFRSDTGALVAGHPSELYVGNDLAGACDLDGDGKSELLLADEYDTDHSTWKGRAFVYRGDDLWLFANQAWFASGDALALDERPGWPGQPTSIWLLDVNHAPFVLRLAGGSYDGAGSFTLSATVPPGLAGIDLGLLAFGIDFGGKLRRSAVMHLEFR